MSYVWNYWSDFSRPRADVMKDFEMACDVLSRRLGKDEYFFHKKLASPSHFITVRPPLSLTPRCGPPSLGQLSQLSCNTIPENVITSEVAIPGYSGHPPAKVWQVGQPQIPPLSCLLILSSFSLLSLPFLPFSRSHPPLLLHPTFRVTVLDIVLYGHFQAILTMHLPSSELVKIVQQHENLAAHCGRMSKLLELGHIEQVGQLETTVSWDTQQPRCT